jgi:membrane-associated phospholipid phosphatase
MPRFNTQSFAQENSWLFYGFSLFLFIGAVILSQIETGDMLLFFSENRSPFLNVFFTYFTKMGEEPAYILAILLLINYAYRYALFLPLIGIVVTYVAFATKAFFKHPRPYLYYNDLGIFDQIILVDDVELHGGANSFPSGHTMSAFALYAFIAFCLPKKKLTGLVLLLIAILVGLSRVYLVQHFFKDVYLGAVIGMLIAMALYWGQSLLSDAPDKWWNKYLRLSKKPTV